MKNIISGKFVGVGNGKFPIRVITTGGTIEKTYDEDDGLLINRNSVIRDKIVSKLRLPYAELEVESILNKDSLEMNEQDRQKICQTLIKSMEKSMDSAPIVVLHGTDTVHLTVEYCVQHIQNPKVAIVFTGAMRPLGFDDSDAWQNVTEALMVCKILPPGIYFSFHNRVFVAPYFRKNKKMKTFEEFN